jgi:predicted double-glycine peptidase
MRRSAAHVALCTLVLVLAGFVAPAWGAISTGVVQTDALESLSFPVHTLRELKLQRAFRRTWHQQYDFSCGSAALATLLTFHYDAPIDETSVFKAMFAVGDQPQIRAKGFSLLDMKKFLESRGYKADGVRSSLDTLISVGVPAIALISDHGYRHFVVVKGADHDRVLLGDPALGVRLLSRRDFEAARVGNLFFVIRSHREHAHFNLAADWEGRLTAPLYAGVERGSLALEILTIPNGSRF